MALVPRYLRPARVIRRRAIQRGLLGPSVFWKVVAAWVFGKSTIKRFFGKQPEPLGTWKVRSDAFVNVINVVPLSSRGKRRRGITRDSMIAAARREVSAARPDAEVVVKS
ncbi:hypothetical protein [Ilumatobacter sp.]|uniref:hypothetical protein n=1 Tax=Ilumatobacter sp. TaxID=1967498 RepID=UPI003B521BA6